MAKVELSEDVNDAVGKNEKLRGLIKALDFGSPIEKATATEIKGVGVSFEPRFKVRYDISFENKTRGIYEKTLVLDKNYDLVCIVDNHWIEPPE